MLGTAGFTREGGCQIQSEGLLVKKTEAFQKRLQSRMLKDLQKGLRTKNTEESSDGRQMNKMTAKLQEKP